MTEKKPRYHLKIIVCGAGGVGKTAIVRRYVEDRFEHNYLVTVGMEPSNKIIEVPDGAKTEKVSLLIFDVAGQERFQTLREVFFRGAHGAFLVFDLTRPKSIDSLLDWYRQILDRVGEIPIILLGNKSDLEEQISVEQAEIDTEIIPRFRALKYYPTSAFLNNNITEAFKLIAVEALKRSKTSA
jgi:small GTP-binding protein